MFLSDALDTKLFTGKNEFLITTKTSSLNESLRSENAKLLCSKRNLTHKSSSDQKKIALHYDN